MLGKHANTKIVLEKVHLAPVDTGSILVDRFGQLRRQSDVLTVGSFRDGEFTLDEQFR